MLANVDTKSSRMLDGFLEFNGNEVLTGAGRISAAQAKLHAETQFEKYRIVQDQLFKSDFDLFLETFETCHYMIGKKVVITGASSGIGRGIAHEVAKLGGVPIMLARRFDVLDEVVVEIQNKYKITAFAYELDVSKVDAVAQTFTKIYSEHGFIDVLINNAGFAKFMPADETPIAEVQAMFDVNVIGVIACCNAVLGEMRAKNRGQIINVASIISKIPTPKASGYAATKHAVRGFTNALRMELVNTNIQVTTINPGPVKTAFFELADDTGNYTKNVAKMMLESKTVAKKVVSTIGTRKRELNLPWWMGIGGKMYAIMPVVMEKTLGKWLFSK